eukprot:6551947-Lingulodinium_polyedra.AAC.1
MELSMECWMPAMARWAAAVQKPMPGGSQNGYGPHGKGNRGGESGAHADSGGDENGAHTDGGGAESRDDEDHAHADCG